MIRTTNRGVLCVSLTRCVIALTISLPRKRKLTSVLLQDRVDAGTGFGTHRHREFEIWSYIVDGELEHKDSLGNTEIMKRGDVQSESLSSLRALSLRLLLTASSPHSDVDWYWNRSFGVQPQHEAAGPLLAGARVRDPLPALKSRSSPSKHCRSGLCPTKAACRPRTTTGTSQTRRSATSSSRLSRPLARRVSAMSAMRLALLRYVAPSLDFLKRR